MNDINTILHRLEQKTKKTKRLNALGEKPTTPSTPKIVVEEANPANTPANTEYITKDGKTYKQGLIEICPHCKKPKGYKRPGECMCGRPRLYATPEIFWDKCLEYFHECHYPSPVEIKRKVLNKKTNRVEEVKVMVEGKEKAITITGLLVHLGMTWESWGDYADDELFSEVVKRAKFYCESEYEQRLQKASGQVLGPLFILKNKFGYKDQQENINTNVNLDAVIDEIDAKKPKVIDADIV